MYTIVKAKDVMAGHVYSYCGATYHIFEGTTADDHGIILFRTVKYVDGVVISNDFRIARHEDEDMKVFLLRR